MSVNLATLLRSNPDLAFWGYAMISFICGLAVGYIFWGHR